MKKIIFFIVLLCSFCFSRTLDEIYISGEVRIGLRSDFPPLSSLQDGRLEGFEVEFAKKIHEAIFKDKNVYLKLVPVTSKERIQFLNTEDIDISITSMAVTPSREKEVDFSYPYLTTGMAIVTNKELKVENLGDLNGKNLLFIPKTTSDEYISQNKLAFSKINLKECSGYKECFAMLQNKQADGYFHSILSIGVIPVLNPNFEVSIQSIGIPGNVAVAVKKGNKELLNAINQAIIGISKTSFFADSYRNTFDPYYRGNLDKKYFLLDDIYSKLF